MARARTSKDCTTICEHPVLASIMPPERKRRQEPVSCEQCRKKKLRCDRQVSCANCRVRNLQCTYGAGRAGVPAAPPADQRRSLDELYDENTAIKSRLQRLEDLIVQQQREGVTSSHNLVDQQSQSGPATNTTHLPESTTSILGGSSSLNGVNSGLNDQKRDLTEPLTISIGYIQEIPNQIASLVSQSRRILIPAREEARSLFLLYIDRVDLIQYVIYAPNITAVLEQVYIQIENSQNYRLGHAALVIGIVASIANYLGLGEQHDSSFADAKVAMRLSTYWLRSALNVLDQAWRSESPDVVTVQATIVLLFLTYHFEALSSRVRFLHSAAISCAKDIGLHATDNDNINELFISREQIIDLEIRRRIWWHLAATDWSLALCGGPQDGTYNINPKHIRVKKPRNISDEELMTMSADFSHPLDVVTPLTYYLHRIRLGEVCREVADLTWELAGSDVGAISYADTVIPLDQKFEDLLNDLPMYSSGDDTSQPTSCAFRRMITQRYFTNLTIQARRCKLHLPFLLRVSRDERYEYSRRICLHAARTMLKFREYIPSFNIESVATKRVRIVGVLHHFFCAIVVLVMDLCMNRSAEPENERKAEIQSACNILEEARHYSGSADVLLEALMDILQKHKVRIQTQPPDAARVESVRDRSVCEPLFDANIHFGVNGTHDPVASGDDIDFGELWQSYIDMGSDITARQWDAIFADLDGSAS